MCGAGAGGTCVYVGIYCRCHLLPLGMNRERGTSKAIGRGRCWSSPRTTITSAVPRRPERASRTAPTFSTACICSYLTSAPALLARCVCVCVCVCVYDWWPERTLSTRDWASFGKAGQAMRGSVPVGKRTADTSDLVHEVLELLARRQDAVAQAPSVLTARPSGRQQLKSTGQGGDSAAADVHKAARAQRMH